MSQTNEQQVARPNEGERRFGTIVVELLQNHFDDARRLALLTRVQHDADGPFVDVRSNADKAKIEALTAAVREIDNAIIAGDLIWKRKRQSDADPYHPANVKMCAALDLIESTKEKV